MSKRGQMQTNACTPFIVLFYTPLCDPLSLLLFSTRQRFGLRAKNVRAENPLVHNGYSKMGEPLAFWDACSKRSVLRMRFGQSKDPAVLKILRDKFS